MSERTSEIERPPQGESILVKEFAELIMQGARENLVKDGVVAPVLFLHFRNGENGIMPLGLPETSDDKHTYFATLGISFQLAGKDIREAVFVSETWYVMAEKEEKLSLVVAPSQHPNRREAITLVGRNAERTRYTFVVQPFSRDEHNYPIFEPIAIGEYDISADQGGRAIGLLDGLFPNRIGRFSMN